MPMSSIPKSGDGLRLARAVTRNSQCGLAFKAGISRFRLSEAESGRLHLTDDEISKISAVLLPDARIEKALSAAESVAHFQSGRVVRKAIPPGDIENVLIVLRAFVGDPELNENEQIGLSAVILLLERQRALSVQ